MSDSPVITSGPGNEPGFRPQAAESPRFAGAQRAPASSVFQRALPHSQEAERAVLGSMLIDESAVGEAIQVFRGFGDRLFYFERHQRLYDILLKMYDESRPIEAVVVKDELLRLGVFQDLGGYDFLAGLAHAVPSALRVRHYAQIVREKALLRQLIGATHRVMETAYDDAQPAGEILDLAERELFTVTEQRVGGGIFLLPDLIREVFEGIDARADDPHALLGVPTGYILLDEMTAGLQRGELIIVAGRPSMGKTAFGLNVAEHMAIRENRPTLFFSLEMSRQQVAQRLLCSWARVDSHRFRRGRLNDQDMDRLRAAAGQLAGRPLIIDDSSNLSVLELRARARMAARRHKVEAIFVDYLQLLRAPGSESRQTEVAEISRGLKALAKELHVPVVAMAQLNRKTEDRTGNRPRMSDLRESGAIEQDADVIMLLHRESYYKAADQQGEEDNTAELIIAKQRNGPVGDVPLHFNKQWTRFDNHQPNVGGFGGGYPDAGYSNAAYPDAAFPPAAYPPSGDTPRTRYSGGFSAGGPAGSGQPGGPAGGGFPDPGGPAPF